MGVAAARVNSLYHTAREKSPCIIFIDEIDAIGRSRSNLGADPGSQERESALLSMLVQMDGIHGKLEQVRRGAGQGAWEGLKAGRVPLNLWHSGGEGVLRGGQKEGKWWGREGRGLWDFGIHGKLEQAEQAGRGAGKGEGRLVGKERRGALSFVAFMASWISWEGGQGRMREIGGKEKKGSIGLSGIHGKLEGLGRVGRMCVCVWGGGRPQMGNGGEVEVGNIDNCVKDSEGGAQAVGKKRK